LKDAYEVPSSAFSESADGKTRVNLSSEDARNLPLYDNAKYTEAPPAMASPFGFPMGGIVWPVASPIAAAPYGQGVYPVAPIVAQPEAVDNTDEILEPDDRLEEAKRIEQSNAVIERGSDVISSDGEKVGEVDSVSFDPESGHPTGFLVRHGILFSEDVEIPAEAVASVDDGIINLKADKEQIDLWSRDNTVLLF
jgi:sporulation protein YlmC with PRC-barrel domain